MSEIEIIITVTLLAGLAMPLGAIIAKIEKIKLRWLEQEFRHTIIAFGGGALLSAVTLMLVPEAIKNLNPWTASFWLLAGSFIFMGLDIFLRKLNTPGSLLAAMLADFIPESLALGATFAAGDVSGEKGAYLLAMLIALQNLPEGFNAYSELQSSPKFNARRILLLFLGMAFLGPVAGTAGYIWLADFPSIISSIMLLASGGILYSIFQDIAPQAKLETHWFPPVGAVLGFMLGMVGMMVTGS